MHTIFGIVSPVGLQPYSTHRECYCLLPVRTVIGFVVSWRMTTTNERTNDMRIPDSVNLGVENERAYGGLGRTRLARPNSEVQLNTSRMATIPVAVYMMSIQYIKSCPNIYFCTVCDILYNSTWCYCQAQSTYGKVVYSSVDGGALPEKLA